MPNETGKIIGNIKQLLLHNSFDYLVVLPETMMMKKRKQAEAEVVPSSSSVQFKIESELTQKWVASY